MTKHKWPINVPSSNSKRASIGRSIVGICEVDGSILLYMTLSISLKQGRSALPEWRATAHTAVAKTSVERA